MSRDVATFFRVLQRHYQSFLDMMRWQLTTRAEFQRLWATDPATLTDLERPRHRLGHTLIEGIFTACAPAGAHR